MFRFQLFLFLIITAIIIMGAYLLFKGPTSEKEIINHTAIVEKIEELGSVEVLRLSVQNTVDYTKEKKYRPDLSVLLMVQADLIYCVDLTKINSNSIYQVGDGIIEIIVPMPQLCHVVINHNQSKALNTNYLWLYNDKNLIDEAYKFAQNNLYSKFSKDEEIIDKAKDSTEKLLTNLLFELGYKKVNIFFSVTALDLKMDNGITRLERPI